MVSISPTGEEVIATPFQAGQFCFPVYVLSLALLGCVRQSTQRVEPAVPVNQPVTHTDSTGRLTSHSLDIYQPGMAQYDYRSVSTIQLLANDSTARTDSTQVTAVLTATFSTVSGRQIIEATLKADSILVVTQPLSTPLSSFQTQFIPLQLDPATGRFLSPRPVVTECNQATLDFIFHGDEVIPAIRNTNKSAPPWTDTTASQICRGGMRIQSTRVSRYSIDQSFPSVTSTTQLVRITDIRMSGTGVQWQQAVQVSGEGTSIDTLVITGTPPRVQQLSGTSQLLLEFRSAMMTQRFLQTSTASITKRTP